MTIQTFPKQFQSIDGQNGAEGEGDPRAINAGRRYCELTTMLDRLHRRYLDVVRLELEEIGVRDINPPQALLMTLMNDGDVPLRDVMQRGGYTASTATYMIKKLVEHGYLEQARATHDRRTMRLRLTRAGRRVADQLMLLNSRHAEFVGSEDGLGAKIADTTLTLRRIDRAWSDFLTFG